VMTIDLRIGALLHLYEAESGLAAIQFGERFRYYEITKNEHIELRSLVYYPSKPDDVVSPSPDVPGTPAVGISREALLAMAGIVPSSLSWTDFEEYDYYPLRVKDPVSRAYFTYEPGFYLQVVGPEEGPIESLKLFYAASNIDAAGFFETFDMSAYTADEIDTIMVEYPEYADWSFTMDDWETDEHTRILPKPPQGTLLNAVKFYQARHVQLSLEGVSPNDYFKQVQSAGFEQVSYNELMIDSDPASGPVLNALFTNSGWTVSMSHSGDILTIAITEGRFEVWNS